MAAVKICGVTSIEDAVLAEAAGARYVGMILGGSGRAVDAGLVIEASRILSRASVVAVITSREALEKHLGRLDSVRILQLHYSYSAGDIESLSSMGYRVIPAVIIRGSGFVESQVAPLRIFRNAIEYMLFDAPKDAEPAGVSGLKLPISCYIDACRSYRPCGAAGGIKPDNAAYLKPAKPDVIDVSSGVESSFGRKDPLLVKRLIEIAEAI